MFFNKNIQEWIRIREIVCLIPLVVVVLTQNIPTMPTVIKSTTPTSPCGDSDTTCVPYFLCTDTSHVVIDGLGMLDIRVQENPCPKALDVCCPVNHTQSSPAPATVIVPSKGCGFRNINGVGLQITAGKDNETQFGEFPWMIAVIEKTQHPEGERNLYVCGGSLIHPQVVLTAAHCIANKSNNILKIRAGEWDTQNTDEIYPFQERDVVEVRIHEHYEKEVLRNDIALLFLESPVTEALENIKTVCLPPANETAYYGQCYVTGWGKDRFGIDGKYQAILKKIGLPIIPNDICQKKLRTTRLSEHFELHDSFICAGGEESKDSCKGDGGSPLVCQIPGTSNRYHQAGIVAWGIGCGENSIPGVYTNVARFREWIDNQFKENKINGSSYKVQ